MRSILPLNLMLRSGGHLPYVLSRLETFANPHDAPSDNTNKRVARSTQGQRERRNVLGTLARFAYVRTNPTCVCVYVCVYIRAHPVSLSWGAAFMRYLRVTCLIIGLARCGFGKFRQRRSYTRKAIAFWMRRRKFSKLGGRHLFAISRGSRLLRRRHVPTVYPGTQWILAFVVKYD